jgi:hypothetical protein
VPDLFEMLRILFEQREAGQPLTVNGVSVEVPGCVGSNDRLERYLQFARAFLASHSVTSTGRSSTLGAGALGLGLRGGLQTYLNGENAPGFDLNASASWVPVTTGDLNRQLPPSHAVGVGK